MRGGVIRYRIVSDGAEIRVYIRQIDGGAERLEAGRGLSVYVGGIIISCLYTIRALMTLT